MMMMMTMKYLSNAAARRVSLLEKIPRGPNDFFRLAAWTQSRRQTLLTYTDGKV